MDFSCDRNLLCTAINNVILAVASKSPNISLEGILMEIKGTRLVLTGYNLEIGISTDIPVNISPTSEGRKLILNATLLSGIVNKLENEDVHFSSDSKMMTIIKCGDAEFTILGTQTDSYPEIPQVEEGENIKLPLSVFRNMVSQTQFAISQTDDNPVYSGSLFKIEKNNLCVVSVDGYRLALKKEKVKIDGNFEFIVPGKALSELLKITSKIENMEENEIQEEDKKDKKEKEILIYFSSKHILFEINNYKVISRLIEGDFLDFNNAIPGEGKTKVITSTREFINTVNRASIIINDRAKCPIKCEFKNNIVKISCSTSLGKVNDSFPVEIKGEEVTVGFNNKYMIDALRASDTDKVIIEMSGPLSPIKIMPMSGDSFLFLVLPVRLKDA